MNIDCPIVECLDDECLHNALLNFNPPGLHASEIPNFPLLCEFTRSESMSVYAYVFVKAFKSQKLVLWIISGDFVTEWGVKEI